MDYTKQILSSARDDVRYDEGLRTYMLAVYNHMTIGLGITGLIAYLISNSPAMMNLIYGTPLGIVIMFRAISDDFSGNATNNEFLHPKCSISILCVCLINGIIDGQNLY